MQLAPPGAGHDPAGQLVQNFELGPLVDQVLDSTGKRLRQAVYGLDALLEDVSTTTKELASVASIPFSDPSVSEMAQAKTAAAGAARSVEDARQLLMEAQASLDTASTSLQAAQCSGGFDDQQPGRPLLQSELWLQGGRAGGARAAHRRGPLRACTGHEHALEMRKGDNANDQQRQPWRPCPGDLVAQGLGQVSEHATSTGTAEGSSYGGASADSVADPEGAANDAICADTSPRLVGEVAARAEPPAVTVPALAAAPALGGVEGLRLGRAPRPKGAGAPVDGGIRGQSCGAAGAFDVRCFRYMEASDMDVWAAQWVLETLRLQEAYATFGGAPTR
mmetsp:Transcript_73234/g.212082  ORF Transcript_73234/g.212082 Transcript_73234/m.212082 type:complete len:335 (+) Transcript_73234:89-1093(+)